ATALVVHALVRPVAEAAHHFARDRGQRGRRELRHHDGIVVWFGLEIIDTGRGTVDLPTLLVLPDDPDQPQVMELAHIVDDVRLGLVNDLRNVGGRRLLPLEDAQDVDLGRFDERSQLPEVRNDQKRCWLKSVASGHAPVLTQLDSFVQELAYEWTADLPMAKDSRYRALLRRSWTFARCMLQLSPSAARVSPSRVATSRARSSSGISEDGSATSLGTRSRYRRSISSRRRASARSATEPCPGMIQLTRSMTSCRRLR